MTDTARHADIVLPATMFLEHDDIYTASAHQHLQFAPKAIEPPEGCRSNHEVICALAKRLGAAHRGFEMSPREIIDATLARLGPRRRSPNSRRPRWIDCQPPFDERAFPRRLRASRRQVPFPRRLAETPLRQRRTARPVARTADPARPLGGQRGRGRSAIRSSSRPRRRAISSIRASTRRRPRARASSGPAR